MVKLDIPRELRTVGDYTYKVLSYGLSTTARYAIEICTNSPRPNFDGIYDDLDLFLHSSGYTLSILLYESACINNLYTFLYSVTKLDD